MEKLLKPAKLSIDPNSSESSSDWKHWITCFQNYVDEFLPETSSEERADRAKLRALISCSTSKVYKLFDHCKTYVEAEETLTKLFVKRPHEIFARHLLQNNRQKLNQSLPDFFAGLVELAKNCSFKDVTASQYQDDMVRDAFINGLLSSEIRQRLLENQTLTMKQAYDQAMVIEEAKRQSRMFHNWSSQEVAAEEVNSTQQVDNEDEGQVASVSFSSKSVCFRCSSNKVHDFKNCRAKSFVCYKCGVKGHISKACYLQKKTRATKAPFKRADYENACSSNSPFKRADYEEAAVVNEFLLSLQSNDSQSKIMVQSEIKGSRYETLLDTGSSKSFISEAVAQKLGVRKCTESFYVRMAEASNLIEINEVCLIDLNLHGSKYKSLKLYVMKNLCTDVLLGCDFLSLHSEVVFKFRGKQDKLVVSQENCHVVVAKVAAPSLFENLTPGYKPIASKSRRYNATDSKFIKTTVKEWKEADTIRRSNSPWRAQCVVVKNSNGDAQRLAIDYSQTINLFTEKDAYPIPLIEDLVNDLSVFKYFASYDLKRAYHQVPIPEADKQFTAFEAGGELYEFNVIPFGVTNGGAVFQRIMSDILKVDRLKNTFVYFDNVVIGAYSLEDLKARASDFQKSMDRRNMTLNDSKTVYGVTELNMLGYCVGNNTIKPDPERLKPLLEMPPPNSSKSLKRVLGLFAYYAKWVPKFSDKICNIKSARQFPLTPEQVSDFEGLKQSIAKAALQTIDEQLPFCVECDASDVAVSATLNQKDRPVAFFSRSLSGSELHYPAVEKEATAIIEAVRKWEHFLVRQHFTLVTDQRSVAFMLDSRKRTKIKNNKILCWRLELASFSYSIHFRPGKDNVGPDALTRAFCSSVFTSESKLDELHRELCCPGVTRLWHYVRSRNLPYSLKDVKDTCGRCKSCAEVRPHFFTPIDGTLVKATQPMERLSIDFKGPLPSATRNVYFLCIVDEFSRYPFCIPCTNTSTSTLIASLEKIFSLFGVCNYIHSDRGSSLMSKQFKDYLLSKGIASSRSTPYHPQGNSQCERYNGVIWKAVKCALKSQNLAIQQWETVLPKVLNSIRSLLCTATGETPHSRFLSFTRRSNYGKTLPKWLSEPGTVLLRNFTRAGKNDEMVRKVELLEANPLYARVRYPGGKESTVSVRDIARYPRGNDQISLEDTDTPTAIEQTADSNETSGHFEVEEIAQPDVAGDGRSDLWSREMPTHNGVTEEPRRSTRLNKGIPPQRYEPG